MLRVLLTFNISNTKKDDGLDGAVGTERVHPLGEGGDGDVLRAALAVDAVPLALGHVNGASPRVMDITLSGAQDEEMFHWGYMGNDVRSKE